MRKITLALLAALLPAIAVAQSNFPATMPANTVYGRLGIGAGPGQPVPVTSLLSAASSSAANRVFAGPTSGGTGAASFRSLVAADFPQMSNGTLWGNPTSAPATPQAFNIPGLTNLSSPSSTLDYMLIHDHTTGTLKNISISQLTGSVSLTSTNTWTGDNYFGSGRPWCDIRAMGAVGDGVTDDTAAWNACVSKLNSTAGSGILFIPPGAYCTFTGFTINGLSTGDIWILGSGVRGSVLTACGHNVNVLYVNQQFGRTDNIAVYGYGTGTTDSVASVSQPAVRLGAGASYWELHHLLIQGGSFPLQLECQGCRIDEVTAQYGYGDGGGSRAANFYTINSGHYTFHSSFDQVLPCTNPGLCTSVTNPTFPASFGSWTTGTAYTVGQVVTASCSGRSFYIQAAKSGTSGASTPPCKPYLNKMTDGGVDWWLVAPNPFYLVQIDSGANEVVIDSTDITGFATACLAVTNTFGVTAPQNIWLHSMTPGGCVGQGYYLNAGSNIKIEGGDFQGCLLSGCAGVFIPNTFSGRAHVDGINFHNGMSYGVLTGAGNTNLTFTHNFVQASTNGFNFGAGVDYITGIGNNCAGGTGRSGGPGANGYFPSGSSGNPGC